MSVLDLQAMEVARDRRQFGLEHQTNEHPGPDFDGGARQDSRLQVGPMPSNLSILLC